MSIAQERILKGQCPNDGKEAAPYRECYDCRQLKRLIRTLKRGERFGVFESKRYIGGLRWTLGAKKDDPLANRQMKKWGTKFHLPETDKRGRPRLQGISVDVQATLLQVIGHIGRPCTIEEITAAWGKLRDRRTQPLPRDLGNLIKAADKRQRKAEKRAAIAARNDESSAVDAAPTLTTT